MFSIKPILLGQGDLSLVFLRDFLFKAVNTAVRERPHRDVFRALCGGRHGDMFAKVASVVAVLL